MKAIRCACTARDAACHNAAMFDHQSLASRLPACSRCRRHEGAINKGVFLLRYTTVCKASYIRYTPSPGAETHTLEETTAPQRKPDITYIPYRSYSRYICAQLRQRCRAALGRAGATTVLTRALAVQCAPDATCKTK